MDRAGPFPEPGTPEWGLMNLRRYELICRDVDGVISASEEEELAWLQRESLAAVDRKYPLLPRPGWEKLQGLGGE